MAEVPAGMRGAADAAAAALAHGFSLSAPPPGFADDPAPVWAALRRHDPVHALGPGALYLTRYDDVLAVYRSPHVSSDKKKEFAPRFGVGTPLYEHHTTSQVFSDPPLHTRLRRILMGAVNQRAIQRMEAGVLTMVDALLDSLADESAPDLIEHFAARIPVEVIGNLLDIPRDERGPLREWSLATLSALEPAPAPAVLARGQAAVAEFLAYLKDLVARRAAHPGDPEVDVLTRLMQGDANGQLSLEEIVAFCQLIGSAGTETVARLLGFGAVELNRWPDQRELLVRQPDLVTNAVEELLRYEAPSPVQTRWVARDVEFHGVTIPRGSKLVLLNGAGDRDERHFPDPDRFDVQRDIDRHLAFGYGTHFCIGAALARLEGRIGLEELLRRYPTWDIDESRLDLVHTSTVRGYSSVPMQVG